MSKTCQPLGIIILYIFQIIEEQCYFVLWKMKGLQICFVLHQVIFGQRTDGIVLCIENIIWVMPSFYMSFINIIDCEMNYLNHFNQKMSFKMWQNQNCQSKCMKYSIQSFADNKKSMHICQILAYMFYHQQYLLAR